MGQARAARSGRNARGNRAAGGWGKAPLGAAWRGPTQKRSSDQVGALPFRAKETADGQSGWAAKDEATEVTAQDLEGTGRGGIEDINEVSA